MSGLEKPLLAEQRFTGLKEEKIQTLKNNETLKTTYK